MLTWNWYGAPKASFGFGSGPTVGSSTTGGAPDSRIWKAKNELDRRRSVKGSRTAEDGVDSVSRQNGKERLLLLRPSRVELRSQLSEAVEEVTNASRCSHDFSSSCCRGVVHYCWIARGPDRRPVERATTHTSD